MKTFKLINNIAGWVVCAIACAVYLLTIEPTASFWDCGEFIATAYKLEIGHPPGAPFFMLMGRICSLFASDPAHVAMMVNAFSALCSGFCILFLFWTITHLARRLVVTDENNISMGETIGIIGAGAVGALAYTFTDTFWFSAVEGEVYAFSSLFTAVVFWAILKWEDCADQPYANRWLVFIAYLMGLSVGVHLLNLLTIPVLGLVYYYRKWQNPTNTGAIITFFVSCVLLVAILYGIIPGFAEVAGWFELFFCNVLGFGYNIGTLVYAVVLIGCLVWGIKETFVEDEKIDDQRRKRINISFLISIVLLGIPFLGSSTGSHLFFGVVVIAVLACLLFFKKEWINISILNTVLICSTVLLLGYSSYAALVIRSAANPPMDENSPDDVFSLKSYLNRDQYGDTPLLYGETYAAEYKRVDDGNGAWTVDVTEKEPLYAKAIKQSEDEPDHYVLYDHKKKYNFCDEFNMLFPRMYSHQPNHISAYKEWAHIKGHKITYNYCGQKKSAINPTFGENLIFFFKYQVGHMYWRYFMWNFVGRQNDIQGNGELLHGNWISGISFIDNALLGDQNTLPTELKNNKGHNTYYFLPLILGILGILYQFSKDKKGMQSFWMTCVLFLMTGLAIVVYLNQTPYQPRERDYAYAGSFYAFCIWIGLGVLYIAQLLNKVVNKFTSATVATLVCFSVPAILAQQNWDDHDRSNRYTCRDFGANYLLTLAPNSIVFTNGDNDTFPLWYNQEVEGVGDSCRVANLSYLQMGWYISQMARDAYGSKGMPISLQEKDYMLGKADVVYLVDIVPELSINDALRFISDEKLQDGAKKKLGYDRDKDIEIIPTKHLYLDVDSAEVVNNMTFDNVKDPQKLAEEKQMLAEEIHKELESYRAEIYNKAPSQAAYAKVKAMKSYRIKLDLSGKSYLGKHELFILDLLANNHWKRPIYYAVTVGRDSYLTLDRYFRLEGMAYRVMPYRAGGACDTYIMENNMLNKFKYGNANDPKVYMEENNLRMATTFRHMFSRLAGDLYNEHKTADAKKVLDYCEQVLPSSTIPYDYSALSMIDMYLYLGDNAKAMQIANTMYDNAKQYLDWIGALSPNQRRAASMDFREQMSMLQEIGQICSNHKQDEMGKKCAELMQAHMAQFQSIMAHPEGDPQAGEYEEEE